MVGGQDELVFDGESFVCGYDHLRGKAGLAMVFPPFKEWLRVYETNTNPNGLEMAKDNDALVYNAVILGLRDYVEKNGFKGVLLGVSGGVDSALVAAIAVDALGSDRVLGVRLPSKFSSDHSLVDAADLLSRLKVRQETVEIEPVVEALRTTVSPSLVRLGWEDGVAGVTDENLQARARGNILMALSNKTGYLLLTTGNKSEISVGYATLYGDMSGGFNVLKDMCKMSVFNICRWRNENVPELSSFIKIGVIPENIINKPPSAELAPGQKDSNSLPEYPELDDILDKMVDKELSVDEISKDHERKVVERVRRLVDIAEYKRRQAAPGVKLTPRHMNRDCRYPITNKYQEGE
jgi:NAD+ synthase